jgi:hypothetical protein
MAELVDALVSGTSDRKVVQVRVLFWAPFNVPDSAFAELHFKALHQIRIKPESCPGGGIGRHTSLRGWRPLKGVQVRVLSWALFTASLFQMYW